MERRKPLNDVLELAHVAGPAVTHEGFVELWRSGEGLAVTTRKSLEKKPRQGWNVFGPVAQRGKFYGDYAQTVIQFFTKSAGLDLGLQILIGCIQDAAIDTHLRDSAEPP